MMLKLKAKSKTHPASFVKCEAFHRLNALARYPYDLTQEGNLTADRLERFAAQACGYQFLYGTERVTQEVMHELLALAHERQVFQNMHKILSGEVVNYIGGFPSENRPALHTATRNFFGGAGQSKALREATQLAKKELEKLKKFSQQVDPRFDTLINIGIGGSDLGPHAHYVALQAFLKKGRQVRFIGNLDPDDAVLALKGLDLKKTLVLVVSKSGSTLETRSNEQFVRAFFVQAGLDPRDHFVAITGEGSPMDDPKQYLEMFYIWDWIGGRYSTTSMVGGVMLSFAFGFERYMEFLQGAHAMDRTV